MASSTALSAAGAGIASRGRLAPSFLFGAHAICPSREHCFWEEVLGIRLCISPDNGYVPSAACSFAKLSAKSRTDTQHLLHFGCMLRLEEPEQSNNNSPELKGPYVQQKERQLGLLDYRAKWL